MEYTRKDNYTNFFFTMLSKAKKNGTPASGKKQLTLMSFFKPANIPLSSPLREKEARTKENVEVKAKKGENVTKDELPKSQEQIPKESKSSDNDSDKENSLPTPLSSSPSKDINSLPVKSLQKRKQVNYYESEDEEVHVKKRRRVIDSESDDDSDEFQPEEEAEDDDMSDFVVEDELEVEERDDESEEEEEIQPKKKSHKPKNLAAKNASTPRSPDTSDKSFSKSSSLSSFSSGNKPSSKPTQASPSVTLSSPSHFSQARKNFSKENEERYQWLVDIKDAQKRGVNDPDYDDRTLYIPQSAWSKFTAFEKQYWEIKSKMWSTVVFFKKGKFFELYENDAVIANTEFDLKIAGGGRANMKLAGIPEMSFEYWAKEFISHGYKIAKVDQKESLLMKEMRGGATKEEKIIKRELTGILTAGTLTDLDMITDDMPTYCMSVREHDAGDHKRFGVAFVDTATAELNMIEFEDDAECSKLDTLVAQVKPKEVIVAKGNLCGIATKILKSEGTIWNAVNEDTEYWSGETTMDNLLRSKYYEAENQDDFSKYPPLLVEFMNKYEVGFHAFGGLLSYLQSLKLDSSIMTLGNFKWYDISKSTAKYMLLDGVTLYNLELFNNSFDGSDKGTLFKLLNRAITLFGKRAMKKWVLYPLMQINEIESRYDAVDFLMGNGLEVRANLEQNLMGIPDLERLLARVHAKTLRFKDFLRVVEGFEKIALFIGKLKEYIGEDAGLLYKYINEFPSDLSECIKPWEDAFDREEAKNEVVVPIGGFDPEFNESQKKLDLLEAELADLLRQYKKEYRSNEVVYRDSGKEIYLIELPNRVTGNVPNSWQQMGSTSKVKRYWSPEVKALARSLMEQRELHKQVCETLKLRMYERFDEHYSTWMATVRLVANIDCLLSLTKSSEAMGESCRPKFTSTPGLNFEELRNPVFSGVREFIPNTVKLGGTEANFNLLTGANAAGKSTLMRTTALAVILSQVGCYVPASLAVVGPVDRIMTRLGANDNIMQGKSTFYVELLETKKLLSNATPSSLVILDELGRGGSSSDGYAIAEGVLHFLATHVQPLGFFATHYGTLGSLFVNHNQIAPRRMGIVLDLSSRNITFLYKLESGVAPGSFGMNVALMCGVSDSIVEKAEVAAKEYEQTSRMKKDDTTGGISLGLQSDYVWMASGRDLSGDVVRYDEEVKLGALKSMFEVIGKF